MHARISKRMRSEDSAFRRAGASARDLCPRKHLPRNTYRETPTEKHLQRKNLLRKCLQASSEEENGPKLGERSPSRLTLEMNSFGNFDETAT
jgi:hypothetical protein